MNIAFNLYRGRPDPATGMCVPSVSKVQQFLRYWNSQRERTSSGSIVGFATNAGQWLLEKKTLETLAKQRQVITCFVGHLYLVVYANGDVGFCEILPPFGNIRTATLSDIWSGPAAEKQRREIAAKQCFCTHECFQPLNLAVNPACYPEMLCGYLEHRWTETRRKANEAT